MPTTYSIWDAEVSYYITYTATSVTFHVTHVEGSDYYIFYWRLDSESTAETAVITRSSDFTYTINGLTPKTSYVVNVGHGIDATSGYNNGQSTTFTTKEKTDIEPWSWDISNGDSTDAQTQNAYLVLQGTITADNFSHNVWNDLVDKANEVLGANDMEWDNVYATLENTKVSTGNTLSAQIYNSIKYNIEQFASTGYPFVSRESRLTGEYIVALTDAINSVIQ